MQTFKKKERLSERKIIQDLFEKGNDFFVSPFRILWKAGPSDGPFAAKIMVAVSTKNFKRAVDRNRIKRIVREAYRKNKHLLYDRLDGKPESIEIIIQYTGKILPVYKETEGKIILVIQRLLNHYE